MTNYFIDYENVKNIFDIISLKKDDYCAVFYSKNANKMDVDDVKKLVDSGATVELFKVEPSGKNALDFQLSSFLGFKIRSALGQKVAFRVVTKDGGFLALGNFWKEMGADVGVISTASADAKTSTKATAKKAATSPEIDERRKQASELLDDVVSKEEFDSVLDVVCRYKTKQAANDNLGKLLKDSEKVGKILKALKTFYK